ncbi:unnamed protein product [Rhizoctonia solani]|uniref:Uncharacterized protein n=1 Tax=Rhizoctonia solani TaxID=456999 RepID=A0A8H3GIW2_9AGAM|nr:unnamed protein product [Rhizoctonia solani]
MTAHMAGLATKHPSNNLLPDSYPTGSVAKWTRPTYTTISATRQITLKPENVFTTESFEAQEGAKVDQLTEEVISCLNAKVDHILIISGIAKRKVRKLDERLQITWWMFKFEWDAGSKTAAIRIPSKLHNKSSVWTHNEFHGMNAQLSLAAPCSCQKLSFHGDATLTYNDGSACQPDGCFTVREGYEKDGATHSRVVIESLRSRPVPAALEKTIVLLSIIWNPTKETKDDGKPKTCRATIEVVVHRPTEDIAIDYPLNGCPWPDEPNSPGVSAQDELVARVRDTSANEAVITRRGYGNALPNTGGAAGDDDPRDKNYALSQSETDSLSFDSNGDTRVEDPAQVVSLSDWNDRIMTRVERLLVLLPAPQWVCSEHPNDSPELDDMLHLDAYDFFRVCAEDPDGKIPKDRRYIDIPLQSLRDAIAAEVLDKRRELAGGKKSNAKAKPQTEGKQRAKVAIEALEIPAATRWRKLLDFAS